MPSEIAPFDYRLYKTQPIEWAAPFSSNSYSFNASQVEENWSNAVANPKASPAHIAEWYAECAVTGLVLYHACVDVNPHIRGGRPVLRGTGFTVASTLAELAETSGVVEVADRFNLQAQTIHDLLDALSLLFERSFKR
jgi:uncharacterized protein (DUF433 family)